MKYFIGIDGGGTKTKCVLCDEQLNTIYETKSGPSNFNIIGTEKVSETILELVKDCCNSKKINSEQITSIVLGTTGAGRETDADKLKNAFYNLASKKGLQINKFKVVSDARIALEGSFSGNPGSILIAGTGSIMFGKDRDGNIHRVGGFGRLIGDEGSGLTLGKEGLNILSKYFDGRGKETSLINKVEQKFDISNQNELITKVYSEEFQVQQIAPLVIEAANEGDSLCGEILEDQTNELMLHIMAMNKKLNEEKMRIVFIGGTITTENAYSKMLKEKIKMFLPKIIVQEPDYSPEIGAVIMAQQT